MPCLFDNSYSRLPDAFFSLIDPTPGSAPVMIRLNHELATDLGIDMARLDSPEGLAILSGNHRPEGSEPLSVHDWLIQQLFENDFRAHFSDLGRPHERGEETDD